jgi:hypothetical protein
MVEPETRRFLLKNRLDKYVEPFEKEAFVTDLRSLEKWCEEHTADDLEVTKTCLFSEAHVLRPTFFYNAIP